METTEEPLQIRLAPKPFFKKIAKDIGYVTGLTMASGKRR
jgi:hypothetical protein